MPWEFAFRCDRCGRKYGLRTGDIRFYSVALQPIEQPVWERVDCSAQDGWCHRCRRPRAIELISPLEALELWRADLLKKGEVERLADVEAKIRWRRERLSQPRCLCCGSAEVEPMGEHFWHPGCGGQFKIVGTPAHLIASKAFVLPAEGPPNCGWLWAWWLRRFNCCT